MTTILMLKSNYAVMEVLLLKYFKLDAFVLEYLNFIWRPLRHIWRQILQIFLLLGQF